MVLVDQSCDGPSAVDPGGHVDHLAGVVQGRAEGTGLMWAMIGRRGGRDAVAAQDVEVGMAERGQPGGVLILDRDALGA